MPENLHSTGIRTEHGRCTLPKGGAPDRARRSHDLAEIRFWHDGGLTDTRKVKVAISRA